MERSIGEVSQKGERSFGLQLWGRRVTCPVAGIEPRLGVATCQPVHAVRGGDLSALRRAPSSWLDLTSDLAWLGLACAARSMGALEVALAFPGPFSNRFMDRLGSYTAGYNRLRTFVCSLSSVTLPSRPKRIIRYPYTAGVYVLYTVRAQGRRWSRWEGGAEPVGRLESNGRSARWPAIILHRRLSSSATARVESLPALRER